MIHIYFMTYFFFESIKYICLLYYLSQCDIIVDYNIMNKFQRDFDKNATIFFQENWFENAWRPFFSRPWFVNMLLLIENWEFKFECVFHI